MIRQPSVNRPRPPAPGRLSRRQFLGASGTGMLGLALPGCTGGGQSSQEQTADGTVHWWDQFQPLNATFENGLFGPYMRENPDVTIERRQLEPEELGQSLQVARRSDQLPDVHTNVGLDTAAAALVAHDWFQPIGDYGDFEGSPLGDQLLDGVHRFNGELYSIPLFSGRWHETLPWINTALFDEADLDPEDAPSTWDELRELAQRISENTDAHGIFFPSQEAVYVNNAVNSLAMVAGAPGEIDWHTGEYVQDSDEFVEAIELLLSLDQDGLLHPASPSMGPRDARARWAAGEGGIFPWGTWFIGGLMVDEEEAVERGVSCWSLPGPEADRHPILTGPAGGQFWVSENSQQPEIAADILLQMTTREFQTALAEAMDQAPALLEVVEEADVHEAYRKCISLFDEDVRIAPSPSAGHPEAWRVIAEMEDIRPHVGDIAQSALAGEDIDIRSALREYREAMTEERDRAIEAVQNEGAEIDVDAWVFSNWDRQTDYQAEDYDAR